VSGLSADSGSQRRKDPKQNKLQGFTEDNQTGFPDSFEFEDVFLIWNCLRLFRARLSSIWLIRWPPSCWFYWITIMGLSCWLPVPLPIMTTSGLSWTIWKC
jgi:hypothetical protein